MKPTREQLIQKMLFVLLTNFKFNDYEFILDFNSFIQSSFKDYYDSSYNSIQRNKEIVKLFADNGIKIIHIDICDSINDILRNNFNI
jgi:hypothetical protein